MALSDISDLLKEQYSADLPGVFTMGHAVVDRFLQAEKIPANTRAVVFGLKVAPGGDFKGISFDDGAYPKGNQMTAKKGTVSSIGLTIGYNVTQLTQFAAKNTKLAIRPVFEDQVAESLGNFKLWLECLVNAASNDGVLDSLLSLSAGSTYNLNPAGTSGQPYGGYLLIPGGKYDIYDAATLLLKRANGPYQINADGGLDNRPGDVTPQVTLGAAITGYVADDRVVAQGLVNASINSLSTHLSSSTSGSWQGILRTKPYARAQSVDAAGATLDAPLMRTLLHAIRKFSGEADDSTGSLVPYMSYEQYRNYQNAAQDIAQIIIGGVGPTAVNKKFDLMMGKGQIEGREILIGNHCDPTKAFFIDFSKFRWVVTREIGFEKNVGGEIFFRPADPTLGTHLASTSWYINYMCNLAAIDVTRQGVIETLALP